MNDLLIEPTKNTPLVNFSSGGKFVLSGSAYAEDAKAFFEPIFKWTEKLEIKEINFDMNIDYINTSSSTKLLELLKQLESNSNIDKLNINWFYEDGDIDHLETGQIMQESLKRSSFQFIKCESVD